MNDIDSSSIEEHRTSVIDNTRTTVNCRPSDVLWSAIPDVSI
jgi:hypothetical protein